MHSSTHVVDGPIWSRDYSFEVTDNKCLMLDEALSILGAKRMVVGHTVQNYIHSECGGKVWLIDTGMSAVYKGQIQVLELIGDAARVISNIPRMDGIT